ncbi:hypothetical protein [Membranihabitans marinus]|uniref:hypothetical protein n=1 Tax=Membranihabitans marinus TaxID=1227546 RepID=UPI001F2C68DB|nr:hypothetical protein [Membranihabitans marinus]
MINRAIRCLLVHFLNGVRTTIKLMRMMVRTEKKNIPDANPNFMMVRTKEVMPSRNAKTLVYN